MRRRIVLATAGVVLAVSASAVGATSGVVGRWGLDDAAEGIAVDGSGYGDNGTVSGGVSRVSGPAGGALHFDGATSLVRVPDAPWLEPVQAVTVGAWVQAAGSPGDYKYVLAKGGSGCIAASYGLYSGPAGGLEFYVSRGDGSVYARSPDAGSGVWDGRWHLAVGTFDGTTIRLYVDGNQIGSGTQYPGPIEYLLHDSNDLLIGGYPSCAAKSLRGSIADVQIWNRALGSEEVSALSQGSPSSSPAGPNSSSPGATRSGSGSGAGARSKRAPNLRALRLAPSRVTHALFANARRRGPVITYVDTQSARVSFTVWNLQATRAHFRCVNFGQASGKLAGQCQHYTIMDRFAHQDRRGRNRLQFPSQLRLALGRYMLLATPSANGMVGKTVSITFRVVT